ncbi:hypothetical protein C4F40_08085 [Sphingobacterium sp. Ka21]|uniref:Secreted protein n=1 Tax=Sphingobacterium pedocola TaxID=2082722 RepID=A0ABR9T7Q0_9SPHI|nr:hypothetical protein [Sphingobacterium pedocola]
MERTSLLSLLGLLFFHNSKNTSIESKFTTTKKHVFQHQYFHILFTKNGTKFIFTRTTTKRSAIFPINKTKK